MTLTMVSSVGALYQYWFIFSFSSQLLMKLDASADADAEAEEDIAVCREMREQEAESPVYVSN
jgi:hypothetical protein